MRRREVIALGSAATVAALAGRRTRAAGAVATVGMLMDTAADNREGQARVAAFRRQLKELGWVEGGNLRIELRWGGGDVDRVRRDAAELVGLSPNVLFAYANAELRPLS